MRNDLETYQQYLGVMAAGVENPAAGFFGPGSMVWRVNRKGVKALGAFRAALKQFVDTQAGQHRRFLEIPSERMGRTLQMQQVILYGSCDEAIKALMKIYNCDFQDRAGAHFEDRLAGQAEYHPALPLWVYGTLVDAIIRSHEVFPQPLAFAEREALYQESKTFGRLMGIPTEVLPADLLDFFDWVSDALTADEVRATLPAREIAGALLRSLAPVFWPVNYILVVGLLPERLRTDCGLVWNPTLALLFNTGVGVIRQAATRIPLRMGALGSIGQARERTKV